MARMEHENEIVAGLEPLKSERNTGIVVLTGVLFKGDDVVTGVNGYAAYGTSCIVK